MQRSRVVLPQPDGPMKAVTARGGICSDDIVKDLVIAVSEIDFSHVDHYLKFLRLGLLPVQEVPVGFVAELFVAVPSRLP